MDQNILQLLATVLSGQGAPLSSAAPAQAPTAMMKTGQPQPSTVGTIPTQDPNLTWPGPNDGGGGRHKGHTKEQLSRFEKKMREIAKKGPRAYTNQIKDNLGYNEPTIGYGGGDPSNFKTGMASALTGTPQPDPNQPVKMY